MLKIFVKLLFIYTCIKLAENRTVAKLTGLTCTNLDKNYIDIDVCQMKAIERDVSETTIHIVLRKKPVDNVTVYFGLKKRGFDKKKSILQNTVDACAFFRNKKRNFLAEAMYKVVGLEKYSNINHTCPYDHDISLYRYRFDQSYVNIMPLSPGSYTLFSTWSTYGKQRASFEIHVQLVDV